VLAAARREILEETGLQARDLRLRGVVNIHTGEAAGILLFVFTAWAAGRATQPSAEGTLEWVPLGRVPELDAVEDLPVLLPRALAEGEPFSAHYSYDAHGRLVMEFEPASRA
jgi:8-oxo-dGTP pyrophosphatase MutT (NUDIX family)